MLLMIAAASSASTGSSSAVSRASARLGRAAAFVAALLLAAPGVARAETGAPLPQGYTSDIPSGQAAAPSLKMQQVSDTDDESDEYADNDPSALTDFQEPLAPYGMWIDDGTYGTVWVPDVTVVGGDFAPYQSAGHWVLDDKQKDDLLAKQKPNAKVDIQRFKGLGEMMPQQLWATTLDPKRRIALRVQIVDKEQTDRVLGDLMGKDPSARFRFIMEHASEAHAIDV